MKFIKTIYGKQSSDTWSAYNIIAQVNGISFANAPQTIPLITITQNLVLTYAIMRMTSWSYISWSTQMYIQDSTGAKVYCSFYEPNLNLAWRDIFAAKIISVWSWLGAWDSGRVWFSAWDQIVFHQPSASTNTFVWDITLLWFYV